MSTLDRRSRPSSDEGGARSAEPTRSLLARLIDVFGSAHYDTIAARKNRRPITTWTPAGWC